jgi:sporadic carbohydrate cluster protein (TIGR04323 family)
MSTNLSDKQKWNQRLEKGSRLLGYDISKFNFAGVVLEGLNSRLAATKLPIIDTLRDINKLPDIASNIEAYRQHLFSVFRTEEFQEIFKAFGKYLIDSFFDSDALLQKSPTARIQLPGGGKSVSFHTDGWYGHGETVFSFWTPLVPVSGVSSLYMARNLEQSEKAIRKIENNEMDLDEINREALLVCDPVEADFGKVLSFSSAMIHGTVSNTSDRCRVSFDFRIAQSAADLGDKPVSNYYSYAELGNDSSGQSVSMSVATKKPKNAWMLAGTCGRASAKSQLIFINEYSKINGIKIIGSESEMVTMKHVPVLQSYISNANDNYESVIMFSVQYLPEKRTTREEIYRRAIERNIKLVFAVEDIVLSDSHDVDRVEECYAVYRK